MTSNPLAPPRTLLRRFASLLSDCADPQVREWVSAFRVATSRRSVEWRHAGTHAELNIGNDVVKIDTADLPAVMQHRWQLHSQTRRIWREGGGSLAAFLLARPFPRVRYLNPTRKKARLWFGLKAWRIPSGRGKSRALEMAQKAAAQLEAMSPCELREWWSEYKAARASGRPVQSLWRDAQRFEDGISFEDLEQMSHAYVRHG